MSLTTCPKCHHHNSWFHVYATMNFKRKFSGKIIKCEKCQRKLILKSRHTSLQKKVISAVLWGFIPLLLILATLTGAMSYKLAIFLVIVYHFLCFIGIIGFLNYSEAKK